MPESKLLKDLMSRQDTWLGRRQRFVRYGLKTGNSKLDKLLGGSWPTGALIELLPNRAGIGELSLVLHSMKQHCSNHRCSVWLNPPYQPFAPALLAAGIPLSSMLIAHSRNHREWLWTADQVIRSGALLFAWPQHQCPSYAELRKLQLAAADSSISAFIYQSAGQASRQSPAVLRLGIESGDDHLKLTVYKLRGQPPGARIDIPLGMSLRQQLSLYRLPENLPYHLPDRLSDGRLHQRGATACLPA